MEDWEIKRRGELEVEIENGTYQIGSAEKGDVIMHTSKYGWIEFIIAIETKLEIMVIGVAGKKQSGKDLVTNIIKYLMLDRDVFAMSTGDIMADLEHGAYCASKSKFKTIRFADKLKDIICLLIGCTREQLEDEEFKNTELGEEWDTFTHTCTTVTGLKFTNTFATWKDRNEKDDSIWKYDKVFRGHTVFEAEDNVKLTPRKLLQEIGTDLIRNQIHTNAWVNATMANYKGGSLIHIGGNIFITEEEFKRDKFILANEKFTVDELVEINRQESKWVIPDVRFPNEVKAIEDKKGFVIRVNREAFCPKCKVVHECDHNLHYDYFTNKPEYCNDCDYRFPEGEEHSSETALDNHKFKYTIDNNGTIEELIEKVKLILIEEHLI